MRCPRCKKQAIGPVRFLWGLNAMSYNCDSCGTRLRANSVTKFGLGISVVGAFAFMGYLMVNGASSDLGFPLTIGVLLIGIALTYCLGGYEVDEAD